MIVMLFGNKMKFKKEKDVSGANAETSLGKCTFEGKTIGCVQKKYSKDQFKKAKSILSEYIDIIEKFGPKIYKIDEKSRIVYMEKIEYITLEDYVVNYVDPWTPSGKKELKHVMKCVMETIEDFHSHKVCHMDPNLGNIMIDIGNCRVKIIDFDEWKPFTQECEDVPDIYAHLEDALSDNIIVRSRKQEASIKDLLLDLGQK